MARRRLAPDRRSIPLVAALLGVAVGARADGPDGAVLLVVDGAVDPPAALAGPAPGAAHFDRAALEALPPTTVRTATPWSEGVVRYEGARVAEVLRAAGASPGARVIADAVNDYRAELDAEELARYPIIVAWLADGEPMTVRTLGPLRIVFPFDDHPELRGASAEARSVWQLVRLRAIGPDDPPADR